MAIEVPLTKGKIAVIDEIDADRVSARKWCAHKIGRKWYAATTYVENGKKKTLHLHRFLLDPAPEQIVDHRNGDGLDNRRSNIRTCDATGNSQNRAKYQGTARAKGVYQYRNRYVARITSKGKTYFLGSFPTERQAAIAYNRAARRIQGEFARLNPVPRGGLA